MGIEPTSDSDCRSTVLKTAAPTRTQTPPPPNLPARVDAAGRRHHRPTGRQPVQLVSRDVPTFCTTLPSERRTPNNRTTAPSANTVGDDARPPGTVRHRDHMPDARSIRTRTAPVGERTANSAPPPATGANDGSPDA